MKRNNIILIIILAILLVLGIFYSFYIFYVQEIRAENYKMGIPELPCLTPSETLFVYKATDTTTAVDTCITDAYGQCSLDLPSTGNYKVKYRNRWRSLFPWLKISTDTLFLQTQISKSPFLDVRYFGAKGDGVTDDYLAIQKAIDSLSSGQIGIYMPSGSYLISQSLKLKNGTRIYGGSSTLITYSGSSDYAFKADSTLSVINGLILENLEIVANDADGAIRLGAVKTGYSVSCHLQNIGIRDLNKYGAVGLKLEGVIHSSFETVGADRINGFPMKITAVNDIQPGPIIFSNCVFGSGSAPQCSVAVELEALSSGIHTLNFIGCSFTVPKRAGVLIKQGSGGQRASNINFFNNTFEHNVYSTSKGLEIEELFAGFIVGNNFTSGNKDSTIGIYFPRTKTCQGITISNNSVVGYEGTLSYFVRVDSTGYDFLDNFYSTGRLVQVTTEISDPAYQLEYFKMQSGANFPFQNPSMQMFYKTAGDTLGIWNGSTWKKIPTQ